MTAAPTVPAPFRSRSAFTIGVLLVGCGGMPAIFLPFVQDVSPLAALQAIRAVPGFFDLMAFAWIAAPFLLAPLVAIALLRWIAHGGLSGTERVAAWTIATAAAASAAWFFVSILVGDWNGGHESSDVRAWLGLAISGLPPFGGLALAASLRRRVATTLAAIVALEMVYVWNAINCLWMFSDNSYQSGAYCAMVTTAAFILHVAGVTAAAWRTRGAAIHPAQVPPTGTPVRSRG